MPRRIMNQNSRMPGAAIAIKQDGVRSLQRGVIRGPAIGVRLDLDAREVCQAFLEELHAGVVFVFARGVAGTPGDENDFFIRAARGEQASDGCGEHGNEAKF